MKLPKKLFKYESFNRYSIRNLKNAQMYFNAPIDFNDPFDCAVVEESVSYTNQDVLTVFNKYVTEGKLKYPRAKKYNDIHPVFIKSIEGSVSKLIRDKQQEYLSQIGCTCFSVTNKYILLWSHYADGHRGFCLEFETTFDPFQNAKKVIYGEDYPKWNVLQLLFGDDESKLENDVLLPLTRKHKPWKYEKEWRVFHREPNKLYGYETNALKAVYFGLAVNTADIEIVCLIILEQSPNTKFYRARKGASRYEVTFEEFFYTPHAKII